MGAADCRWHGFDWRGLASWLQFGQPVSTGLIAALAYLGPRGAEVLFIRWFGAKVGEISFSAEARWCFFIHSITAKLGCYLAHRRHYFALLVWLREEHHIYRQATL